MNDSFNEYFSIQIRSNQFEKYSNHFQINSLIASYCHFEWYRFFLMEEKSIYCESNI